ncbi:MAG: CRISPR-associated helicase Cas3 [Chthonomonadales bacterium]|nr:CRISPR-associated helicase Cas3 [Chthonomonadales bacterium]
MLDKDAFLRLWGKTNRPLNTTYHPLLFHLYDVAFCAEALWLLLPIRLKQRIAEALHMDIDRAGRLFVLLAGLHDLGKANPEFQKKAGYLLQGLLDAEFDFPADLKNHPHNFVSVPEVERLIAESRLFDQSLSPELARLFAYALGAHHGVFPQTEELSAIYGRTLGVHPRWEQARNWLAEQLQAGLTESKTSAPPEHLTSVQDLAFAPLLAALISLADWFGSSKYFGMQGVQDIGRYRAISKRSAAIALERSGWTSPPPSPTPKEFAELFAYLDTSKSITPNALQQNVLTLLESVHSPTLWILEEEMGAGKTEAAFTIFDHAHVHGLAHGTYIAMPTQATSNAMHARLGHFLEKRHPAELLNLILAHSHAMLDENYRGRIEIGENFTTPIYNEETQTEEGALLVRAWFTHSKQTLLAHYGVGTIDQALLGVLQTRHWFVRLFGLAGKVVIFDEVHAYDAYMNTLLVRLIEWLAELDCTVVLLSATLPKSTRLALANAYTKGAKTELMSAQNQAAYPRITLVPKDDPATARALSIVKDPSLEPKRIALSHLPCTPATVLAALLDAIPGDGCAIVICNTVNCAQEMYAALKAELEPQGWNCLLFHARTPFKWRKEKEEQVLELFGKESGDKRTRPRGKTLLVATQVVEQSLDLDADFMASEIAPADLILQRMGRLWRHLRIRTAHEARFALLYASDVQTGLPDFGNSAIIYSPHTLLRSWLVLKDRTQVYLPTDIEPLVCAVYDTPDPTDLPETWTYRLEEAKAKLERERREQQKHAKAVSVRKREEGASFTDWIYELKPVLRDEDDPEVHQALRASTRDGDPSITLVLCGTDENGNPLAPDPSGPISPEMVQEMMSFSLPVSLKAIYHALKSEQPPANWQKNAHLRYCRRVVFLKGASTAGTCRLILTRELGLEVEALNK